jgi:hypothetical protein
MHVDGPGIFCFVLYYQMYYVNQFLLGPGSESLKGVQL